MKANKTIAQYMGRNHCFEDFEYENGIVQYHSSWDWLMPVVKKIKDRDEWAWWYTSKFERIRNGLANVDIEEVWISCIELIGPQETVA